jgi:hypothetical protein
LRRDIFGELFDDVIGLSRRQAGFYGPEITIDDLHNSSLYSADAQDHEAHLAKVQGNFSQLEANLRQCAQGGGGDHES